MPRPPELAAVRQPSRACWCGGEGASELGVFRLGDGEGFPLVQCNGCGVLALWPQPNDAQLQEAYAAEYYGASRRKFIAPIAAFVSMFQRDRANLVFRHAPRGSRVLDVGCGNGGFLVKLQKMGYDVEGTEWTDQSASRVPRGAGFPVHIGDLMSLRLAAQSYDVITLWHVFEHLRAPQAALLRIRMLLRPGGTLIMSMPNAQSAQARRFGLDWFHHDPPRHLHGFGPDSLGRLMEITGFQVRSLTTWSWEQNPFGWIQSWLNARGFPRDRAYQTLKGVRSVSLGTKAIDLGLVGLLTLPAMVIAAMESMRRAGATMTVVAR
jgi:SAM-dependent methyltransferase